MLTAEEQGIARTEHDMEVDVLHMEIKVEPVEQVDESPAKKCKTSLPSEPKTLIGPHGKARQEQ